MRNQTSSPSTTLTTSDETIDATRARVRRTRRNRRAAWIASGAIVTVGALVGSGFAVQSAVADQERRVAETAAIAEGADRGIDQLDAAGGLLAAHAVKTAEDTLKAADATIAQAEGKADASELASTVATLDDYTYLAPERVFELVDLTSEKVDEVKAKVTEFEKKAAEKAAAEKAAAEKAAAEKAAAEAAEQAAAPATPSYPTGPANPSGAQAIARDLMASMYGWGSDQFGCLVDLWNKESGWNVYAQNPSSGAYGIPQALPGSKMSTAGADWATSASTQITWGLGYIAGRYGTPCGAWSHSVSVGWY
ncbi:aggregation-promoting factor C-terminal-like domain-containing protein [Agromyces binzhouensis]|uniref:aggregation-promoting factor C-terminal-like domain-containing protein n=1 Tax=Agromyces binzhouensis TaxID=1817495 RepID=UPI003627A29B